MPSKEQLLLTYPLMENTVDATTAAAPEIQQHPAMRAEAAFLSQDMEQLVCEIKENLRLSGFKHRPSSHSASRRLSRASPYPTSFSSNCSCKDKCMCRRKRTQGAASSEDPYERLQELIRDGSLIKEAVRRLTIGLSPKQRYYYDDSDESTAEFPTAKFATCDS
jgi:hypothetical protein